MKAPSFYSDPHVQFLSQLLEEIADGNMQVPRFQRPLVWRWDRRLELLRSVRDGIPIGSIMVWRSNDVAIDCYSHLGPYRLRKPQNNMTRQYILDGVQRLSTLYGALHRPLGPIDISDIDEVIDDFSTNDYEQDEASQGSFDVFFDPSSNDFVNGEEVIPSSSLMPLYLVFDSIGLLRFQRGLSGLIGDEAVEATDRLARAFRDYKLPVIPITTEDINLATRTFQRINSQGVRMSETHMVHALTWSPNFDLHIRLRELKDTVLLDAGWHLIEDDTILKSCKAAFGLDVYKASADEISSALSNDPARLESVFDGLKAVANFLRRDCGVPTPDLVPYALQIVVLSEAFRENAEPTDEVLSLLRAWFWMTTYGELFAGMSGDRVALAILDMKTMVSQAEPTWTWKRPFQQRPLRPTFDFRAARAKAFAFRLAAMQDQVFGANTGTNELSDSGRKSVIQILPWKTAGKAAYASPGNRFLIRPALVNQFRESLLEGALSDDDKKAHFISDAALEALIEGRLRDFVDIRTNNIVEQETRFLGPLVRPFIVGSLQSSSESEIATFWIDREISIRQVSQRNVAFNIGLLQTMINISLSEEGGNWAYRISHAIKTPLQAAPYWTSRPFAETREDAISRAIEGIASYYREAVDFGLQPDEQWLISGN